jgi:hypothetical protein
MKVLSPEQMLSLMPLSPAQLQVGEMLMAKVMPEFDNAEANLHYQVQEGFLKTAGIQMKRELHYCVFYHVAPGHVLYVNGIQRMNKSAAMETAIAGLELLAKSAGCKCIAGTARRAGFVRELMRNGYLSFGVTVLKKLS